MQVASSDKSTTSLLSYFGSEVRRYRLAAGLSQERLGKLTHYTAGMVGHIENAKRIPSPDFAEQADQVLHANGALAKLWPLLTDSARPNWFRPMLELEQSAVVIHEFETITIPGPLQTEGYARALFACTHPTVSDEEIGELIEAHTYRQRLLTKRTPSHLVFTLDEGVIRRRIGGNSVMAEQLRHLVAVAELPNVHLQVIPFSTQEHPGGLRPFRIMGFGEGADVLYSEAFVNGHMTSDSEQLRRHRLAFDLILAKSLSQDDSRMLIQRVQQEIRP
ncbi:helix-turn-helix domain-containing protein [Allosalinactinospora lopnorensis]|uniref:helix-turn-helix domain-containing protein n=1 Tax=Allosalinactinospora lopnorensis TaxID=1352348 RepID=UPI000623D32D|nr:helix-turn-helix transcriptional regulator [Allosalinactinospora lopnorensis]